MAVEWSVVGASDYDVQRLKEIHSNAVVLESSGLSSVLPPHTTQLLLEAAFPTSPSYYIPNMYLLTWKFTSITKTSLI